MVKIRLARVGAKKKPFYRIVVADVRAPRDGTYIEQVGTYDPNKNPYVVNVKEDRISYWIENGAQPTQTVAKILKKTAAASVRPETQQTTT